jgi:cell division protein FtsI/penicillin-binding protein 2
VLVSPYEPGSTLKPFIAGPALAWRVTRPDEIFRLGGKTYTTPYGRHVTDVHGYDQLCMWDVLVKSSNIGMSMLAERMGNEKIWKALTNFGFGQRTGIELPGESGGKLSPLKVWTKYSTESTAQGYELMVTPLQLARGVCVYANGGKMVKPRVIKGFLDADGNTISEQKPIDFDQLPQVIDEQTAKQVRRILCDVVIRGTATKARSKVWNIFGKTGTAHISEGHGYSETKFTSSFIGGAPAEDPRLVVAFIVHKPDKTIAHYGGTVSAPGASRLLDRALAYMQLPSSPDLPLPPTNMQAVLHDYNPHVYLNRMVSVRD